MTKFEYKSINVPWYNPIPVEVEILGNQGWELVTAASIVGTEMTLFFKRIKND